MRQMKSPVAPYTNVRHIDSILWDTCTLLMWDWQQRCFEEEVSNTECNIEQMGREDDVSIRIEVLNKCETIGKKWIITHYNNATQSKCWKNDEKCVLERLVKHCHPTPQMYTVCKNVIELNEHSFERHFFVTIHFMCILLHLSFLMVQYFEKSLSFHFVSLRFGLLWL